MLAFYFAYYSIFISLFFGGWVLGGGGVVSSFSHCFSKRQKSVTTHYYNCDYGDIASYSAGQKLLYILLLYTCSILVLSDMQCHCSVHGLLCYVSVCVGSCNDDVALNDM
jgi:hypothetical protein